MESDLKELYRRSPFKDPKLSKIVHLRRGPKIRRLQNLISGTSQDLLWRGGVKSDGIAHIVTMKLTVSTGNSLMDQRVSIF